MNEKLREHIDMLFEEAPLTRKTVEIKEEILQNLIEKYEDLLAQGKTPEAAYNIAAASVGDISELVDELKRSGAHDGYSESLYQKRQHTSLLRSIAVAMYICCIVPTIVFDGRLGAALMFIMIAAATGLMIYSRQNGSGGKRADTGVMVDDFKQWRSQNNDRMQLLKSIKTAVWTLTVVLYIMISFWTSAWGITWVIFLIAVAATNIIEAVFDYKKEEGQ
ncbi:permease prefix domain 1-containing protein [Eubacteriales bacterium OttesenSCG-928-K08]|nr:permease prefix domain 1-containing protein [Eubacteriales bacterium OttesenSCG-928-K08]